MQLFTENLLFYCPKGAAGIGYYYFQAPFVSVCFATTKETLAFTNIFCIKKPAFRLAYVLYSLCNV